MSADLRAEHSLILRVLGHQAEDETRALLKAETRWHYSQHYFAESKGEEVIEDILHLAHGKKQRALLGAQLRDEKEHQLLFRKIVDKTGLDERALSYAEAYSKLVSEQESLAEKVYVFQIITEAASAAYCEWRLRVMTNPELNKVDASVKQDEQRHLVMGGSMLSMCEVDDIRQNLPASRRMRLVREMNEICREHGQKLMYRSLLGHSVPTRTSELDRTISRMIISEIRKIENLAASF